MSLANIPFEEIVERISDAFVALDNKLCYIYMNKKCGEMFGRNPKDLIGKHVYTEFPEVVGSSFQVQLEKAIKEQKVYHIEEYFSPHNKWYISHIYPSKEQTSIYFTDITDQIIANNKMVESEENYRTLAETSPDCIMRYDEQLRHIYVNKTALDVTGYQENEIIGKTHRQAGFNLDQSKFWEEKIEYVFKTGESILEYFLWESAKGTMHLDWKLTPEMDENGKVKSVLGVSRNLTESRMRELELEKAQKQLSFITNHLPFYIAQLDAEKRYRFVNNPYAELFGWTPKDFTGKLVNEILGDEYYASVKPHMKKAISGETVNYTIQLPASMKALNKKIEKIDHVEVSYIPEFSEKGIVTGFIVAIANITEIKKVEKDLVDSELLFRSLTEGAPVGIFQTDLDGNFTYVNEEWVRFAGIRFEEALINGWTQAIHPHDRERVFAEWERAVSSQQTFKSEFRFLNKAGAITWVTSKAISVYNSENRMYGYIGMNLDITERKITEEKILSLNKDLEERVKERTAELEEANKDLQEVNELFLGREARIIELKEELDKLKEIINEQNKFD